MERVRVISRFGASATSVVGISKWNYILIHFVLNGEPLLYTEDCIILQSLVSGLFFFEKGPTLIDVSKKKTHNADVPSIRMS